VDIRRKRNLVPARVDHLLIAEMVRPGARVLDVGCGDGELLSLLEAERDVDGRGIELSQSNVNLCVAKGLSVIQGDADRDLTNFPDASFDYAILSQTLQATRRPRHVLEQLLRIGRHAVVSFPNFGHWRIRLHLLTHGRMPVTPNMPETWYETPNIHYCTIKDFLDLCTNVQAKVERSVALNAYGQSMGLGLPFSWQNLIGEQAVFLLTKGE
jgi:methionine biosynthesis protein MetW